MSENSLTQTGDAANREAELESVIADYIRACDAKVAPDQGAILERNPELADDLRAFFAQRDRMDQLAEPIRGFGDELLRTMGPGKHLSYVGDYELLDEVARGGMGVVYKARQKTLGRIVAVKMMLTGRLANEDDVKRFQIEAQAAANLQHPNIVPIHEVGQHEGLHYFSMDFVEGRSLSAVLHENVLPAKQAATYVRQMAEAIHYAHQQGTLHRDLKPSNVLIDTRDQVHITDFGLATRIEGDSGLTQTGQIVGTPSYMPPEQAQGKRSLIGPGSDVYSLGAILYECLTGRAPFRADSVMKTIEQVIHVDAASPRLLNPGIARDLETICLKCLEKEPHRRYGTAQLLADDLQRYLEDRPIQARPVGTIERTWRWCRRKPVVAGLSSLSVFAIAMTIIVLVYSREMIAAALLDRTTALRNLGIEQGKTQQALTLKTEALEQKTEALQQKTEALQQKTEALQQKSEALKRLSIEERKVRDALVEKSAALKRERITAYANTLTLARREWLDGNLARTNELLNSCHPDLRHWEWHYLRRLCEPASLHTASSTAGMPHSSRIPTTSDHKFLQLYHGAKTTGEEVVYTNASTGSATSLFRVPSGKMGQLAVSGNGRVVMSGLVDRMTGSSHIHLYNADSGESSYKVELPNFYLNTLAVNVDGTQWAASGSVPRPDSKSTSVYEVRLWKKDAPYKVILTDHRSLVFSPDGKRLLTGYLTGFELWETNSYSKIAADGWPSSHATHTLFGAIPCFYRNNTQFVFAAGEFAAIYDAATGRKIRTFHLSKPAVTAVACGDDDQKVVYGTLQGNVVLLDLQSGQQDVLLLLPHEIHKLEFSPDGSRLITMDQKHKLLQFWDAKSNLEFEALLGHAEQSFTATFDSSGRLVATIGADNKVRVWNVATRELKHELGDLKRRVYDVAFSASGTELATAGDDGIQVWNLKTGAVLHRFVTVGGKPMEYGTRVEFARRGNWLAGGHRRGATIWDRVSGREVRSFRLSYDEDWISSARFTVDGSRLATCGIRGELQLWDTSNGREFFKLKVSNALWTLAFSPDEKQIVACGPSKDILNVDAQSGKELGRLTGHANGVNTVSYSSDGKRLVSAGSDGVLKIWETETGLELLTLQGGKTTCFSASFSPDCRRIITTEMGALRIFDAGVVLGPQKLAVSGNAKLRSQLDD